jgi:crooked neck
MPTRILKKVKVTNEDGTDGGIDESYQYVFPDQKTSKTGSKLIEAAKKWKEQKEAQGQ